MGRYIVKRIFLAILTVFIICAITFFVMNAIPGGPFNREKALSAATIEALNRATIWTSRFRSSFFYI